MFFRALFDLQKLFPWADKCICKTKLQTAPTEVPTAGFPSTERRDAWLLLYLACHEFDGVRATLPDYRAKVIESYKIPSVFACKSDSKPQK